MDGRSQPKVLSERRGKWLLNLYPPFVFNRIRVMEVGEGFRRIRVRVARSLLTRNLNGTTFGGSIFSAADPFYSVMYWQIFARRGEIVQVWLKSAAIRYRKPAATALILEFALTEDEIERTITDLSRERKITRTYRIDAVDEDGEVCAEVETVIDIRLPEEVNR